MNKHIEIISSFRSFLLSRIDSLNTHQLNHVPPTFNNNIIWNLGHLNSVLQALCYKSSGLPTTIDDKYFYQFLPGTKPTEYFDEVEIQIIKRQIFVTVEKLDKDLENGLFKSYNKVEKIEKVYNIKVESIHDAIAYVVHHEGIHLNAILALKRVVENGL